MFDINLIVPDFADFANISFFTRDFDGAAVEPDAPPVGRIFRVNPVDGSIALDVALGSSGFIDFVNSPPVALTTFWQYPLSLSNAVYNNYFILVTYLVASVQFNIKIDLLLSSDGITGSGGVDPSSTPPFISHVSS